MKFYQIQINIIYKIQISLNNNSIFTKKERLSLQDIEENVPTFYITKL